MLKHDADFEEIEMVCVGALPDSVFKERTDHPPLTSAEPDVDKVATCIAMMNRKVGSRHQFNDKVSFKVQPDGAMIAFSASIMSDPHHACDWGQNWNNIATPLRKMGLPWRETLRIGCDVPRPEGVVSPFHKKQDKEKRRQIELVSIHRQEGCEEHVAVGLVLVLFAALSRGRRLALLC